MPTRISTPAGGVNRFAGRRVRLYAKIVLELHACAYAWKSRLKFPCGSTIVASDNHRRAIGSPRDKARKPLAGFQPAYGTGVVYRLNRSPR